MRTKGEMPRDKAGVWCAFEAIGAKLVSGKVRKNWSGLEVGLLFCLLLRLLWARKLQVGAMASEDWG